MLLRTKTWFTSREAEVILQLSHYHMINLIRRGDIPARKRPRGHIWRIEREDMLKFMIKNGYPPELYRGVFSPPKGALMWLGKASDLEWADLARVDPTYCRSPFKLSRLLCYTPTWGIVMDLTMQKGWLKLAKEICEDKFCPVMIALTEGPKQTSVASRIFDLVLPRPFRSTEAVAESLLKFRRQRTVKTRVLNSVGTAYKTLKQE